AASGRTSPLRANAQGVSRPSMSGWQVEVDMLVRIRRPPLGIVELSQHTAGRTTGQAETRRLVVRTRELEREVAGLSDRCGHDHFAQRRNKTRRPIGSGEVRLVR